LVNNVGVTRHGDAEHVTEEDWDFMFDVNLKSMMLMSRYAIPYLSRSGAGSIINISSTGAVRPPGGHIAYDTSKGGVVSLTISLAVEQGRNGIRANCIMPGRMITPMVEEVRRSTGISPEQWDAAMRLNLLGRLGSAWDIAAAAVFLASDDAAWITSVVLPVDGGFLHTPPGFRPAEPLPAPASEVVDRYQDSAEPGRVPQ
jgi:NAD(P)-dependent dehydrogenase (short-subunit alcohol dehydrogenase family)